MDEGFPAGAVQSVVGPLVAVAVTLVAQFLLVRRGERRQSRRAFAEAMDRCCDVLESDAVHYWMDDDSKTRVLVGRMHATLAKMNRLISDSKAQGVKSKEAGRLRELWKGIRRELRRDFGVGDRRVDLERMAIVIDAILGVRCEAAKLRA